MRPYWKGYLKLALISCPIALHAACSTSERISFRQINKATGNRLRQQLVDEETREPVGPEHKGRGYEVAKRRTKSTSSSFARPRVSECHH
jgi:DNA end-binding protein Ku